MRTHKKRVIVIFLVILCIGLQGISVFASDYVTLKYGSRGNDVVNLQKWLISKGYLNDSADGIYGPLTEKAIIKFQIASHITVDGIAGKQTQSTLYQQPVSRGASTSRSDYATNLYWLSRIIHAESEAEPYKGKLAVGNVILNRVNSNEFPSTVKGVIFEYYKGIPQFSPVAEGTIYTTPSQTSIQAAKDVLNGDLGIKYATYFFNPDKAKGSWIVQNKTYMTRIGNHVFYQ
ncbi:cell wall hydrolase [Marinisporobacter balticus]|uniref:N-acetylmuramoyl-L-alanine amidase n=1 Tax=Marinisporobacter balticus TaxID=2018667 RepID=A0A4V2SCH8_9FIRM|nr:cell wall hydrolase [Marinisporobacter balticus]TCO79410.1 N-acetylmuramoyl-L-alanine amidase [Marinisporobacter balticus]